MINSAIKKTMSNIWRWSWCLTLPITLFFFIWAHSTYKLYNNFGVRYDPNPFDVTLYISGKIEFNHMLQTIQSQLRAGTKPINSDINVVDLFINDRNKNQLNSELPYSGRKYVGGMLVYPDGKINKISMKYRGDNIYHWGYYKKSIRIKTKKGNLYNGIRLFNIINPKTKTRVSSHISHYMANIMGLISVDSEVVALRINGEYKGVYLFVEQLTETTLRNNNRMPGDIYSGEFIGKDTYEGVQASLFNHAGLWNKSAVNNHYPEIHNKPMEAFINNLGALSTEDSNNFWDSLNHKQWGRFAAFTILTQSFHYDNTHNWRLYYDPAKAKFEPAIWDPMGFHNDWMPDYAKGETAVLDVFNSTPTLRLLKDYRFRIEKQLAIEEFFAKELDKKVLLEVARTVKKTKPALEQDINIISNGTNIKPNIAIAHLESLPEKASKIFHDIKDGYLGSNGSLKYRILNETSLRVGINGRNMVRKLKFIYDKPVKLLPKRVFLTYLNNGKKIKVDVSNSASLEDKSLVLDIPLLNNLKQPALPFYKTKTETTMGTYDIIFEEFQTTQSLNSIMATRGGNVTHNGQKLKWLSLRDFNGAISIITPDPITTPIVWKEDIKINKTTTITNDLIIKPGVTIKLAEDALLIVKGKFTAIGTPSLPIKFIPEDPNDAPWGAVVLKGKGASGSHLNYTEFSGGSGVKEPLFEYSAMLSLHDARTVTINNSKFKNSKIVDDMVHAVYSNIIIKNSTFENSLFDALDIDISTAVIDSCTFTGSGNDSIDLMTSKAVIKNSTITGSGDKGISVGENSQLLVINTSIDDNAIGLQSKDSSTALLFNVTLNKNGQSLHAYKKNWMYDGGGAIGLYKSTIDNNKKPMKAEKKSLIWTYDSYIDRLPKANKRVKIDSTVDSTNKTKSSTEEFNLKKDIDLGNPEFFEPHWPLIDSSMRGTF